MEIRDNEEKDSAFRGFCTLVKVNPQGIERVRLSFFTFVPGSLHSPRASFGFAVLLLSG